MAVAGKAWPPRKKEENSSQQISLSLLPQTLCRRSGEAHPNAQPGSFHTDFSMETKPASPGGSCSSGCCSPGGEQSEIALPHLAEGSQKCLNVFSAPALVLPMPCSCIRHLVQPLPFYTSQREEHFLLPWPRHRTGRTFE